MVAKVSSGNVSTGSETVEELLNAWLDHIGPNRSPTTIRKYRDLADRIVIPELGKVRLKALTARQLDRLYGKLTAKGNKATSVRRVHALIAAALHQAERWDMVDHSVARKASPPPIRPEPVKAPTPDEVRAIVAKAEELEPALAALLLLGALTGARRGELCALRWTDLDVAGRTLTIARSVYETEGGGWAEKGTKTHQERTIGLDDLALGVLAKHRAQVDELADGLKLEVRPDGFMFSRSPVGAEPMQPDFVSKFAKKVATKARGGHPSPRPPALLGHPGHRRRLRPHDGGRPAGPPRLLDHPPGVLPRPRGPGPGPGRGAGEDPGAARLSQATSGAVRWRSAPRGPQPETGGRRSATGPRP